MVRCVLFRECDVVSVCQRCKTGLARPPSDGCRSNGNGNGNKKNDNSSRFKSGPICLTVA